MTSRNHANLTFNHLSAMLEKETAGLTGSKRLRAINRFHMCIDRKLWKLRDKALREAEREFAAEFRRMARAESDPAKKAELRRIANVIAAARCPESALSA